MLAVPANHWPEAKCAKAFWGQHDLPPYRQLLADTLDWAAPRPGEKWLDLGCGGGAITRALWEYTEGQIGEIVGLDCAAANSEVYDKLRTELLPPPGARIRFLCHDFSRGLSLIQDASFDHAVSGLSISYAESFDPESGKWNTEAYDRLLGEVCRVLRPGGRFVFSVNVPNPSWGRVARYSLRAAARSPRPLTYLKKSWRMLKYGRWLKQEAKIGRFHYLPAETVTSKLKAAGFTTVSHRMSYCDQAYIFQATIAP
jgi:ubiquinone/menaquinone biosynthesis C-methylase UbiE